MSRWSRTRTTLTLAALTVVLGACVFIVSTRNHTRPLTIGTTTYTVKSAVRAHMTNGDVVIYPGGATVTPTTVTGVGQRFNITRTEARPAGMVSTDSIVGLEAFVRYVNPQTLLYLPAGMVASGAITAALLLAIFGSCPTIYADSAGTQVLQAESFSYSIAPLMARRDVDLLNVRPDSNGIVRLEIRNEALETHYVDQLELLEVRHAADEIVVPAARMSPVAVRDLFSAPMVRDSRGRDVSRVLARVDDAEFASQPALVNEAAEGKAPPQDYLDIAIPRTLLQERDSLALVLTMRSSLMSTVIFYEYMLARPGARSLDWLTGDLDRITSVAQLARWYTDRFGLRVLVREGNEYRQVVRLMDFGPAAWRNVAALIPPVRGDTVHVRLAFVPDEFHIDRVALSTSFRAVRPRAVPVTRLIAADGKRRDDARDFVRSDDDRQLVTEPGTRYRTEFDVGRSATPRTFLLAADGYYVEWLRPSWMREAGGPPFSTATSTLDILRSWRASKDTLEARFFRNRVPVL